MVYQGRLDTVDDTGLYAYLTSRVEVSEVIRSEDADHIYIGNAGRFFG
jgi:hypothetical protein